MPYIWAKKFSKLDEELPISTSNMFYPAGLSLSRKGKLSLIWLAANYDPDKYRKIIPPRKCEEADIANICAAIMNPTVPYALRLSAQLLLGTVRVYRTKIKLILEMAEQMIVKLSSLISETCTRSYDMPIAMLRADAITIADTGMSIIDYSLEPVYYDPQMIMHMNEEDFITVNGSPLQSPIKIEKKSNLKKSLTPKTPIVVSNSKISFQEDLLSPSKPIQVPTEEEDFGVLGFGPAQDNFLADLMEISDINLQPKVLDFGPDEEELPPPVRLEPVLEDDEYILAAPIDEVPEPELRAAPKDLPETRDGIPVDEEAMQKVEVKDGVVLEGDFAVSSLPDETSRKRKVSELDDDGKSSVTSGTSGRIADLDQLLKEATEISEALKTRTEDVFGETKEGVGKVEEAHQPTEDVAAEEEELHQEFDKEDREEVGEKEVVDDPRFVIEPVYDKSTRSHSESSITGVPGVPMDWELNMQTPSDTIILKPVPDQPKKKRKLMVDKEIFIQSKDIKNNLASCEKIIRMPMIAGSAFPTGKEMFTLPILKNKLSKIKFWWENNTERDDGDPIAVILPQDFQPELEDEQPYSVGPPSVGPPSVGPPEMLDEPMEEEMVEKEVPMDEAAAAPVMTPVEVKVPDEGRTTGSHAETPSSIDILRAESGSLKSFEQSGGSIIPLKETPLGEALKVSIDNINVDDEMLVGPTPSPRISGIGLIPQDAEINLDEAPELDVVLEQDEKSVDFTAGWLDDSDLLSKDYKLYQSRIFHSLRTSNQTVFQRLFPSSRTKKRDAALALYLALNMHKNGYVELQQTELFGDIYIYPGRIS